MNADTAFALAIAGMIGGSLYFGPRIDSPRMAMQWGMDGKPTSTAPKAYGVWGLVAFAATLRVLTWAATSFVPGMVHEAELGLLLASIVVAAAHLYILFMAANSATPEM
jgi:hypothetical protein